MGNTCDYVFTIEKWLRRSDRRRFTDITALNWFVSTNITAWTCPHETHDGSDKCIIHMDIDERRRKGIEQSEVRIFLKDCVESENKVQEFIGGQFEELNFEYGSLVQIDKKPIRFSYSTFHGEVNFSNADIGFCHFTGSDFHKNVSFHNAEFKHKAIFTNCRFRERTSISADCIHYVNFDGSTFESDLYGQPNFSTVTIREVLFEGEVNFRVGEFESLNLSDSEIHETISLSHAEIGSLNLNLKTIENDGIIDLSGAEIQGGVIRQPENGQIYCDFSTATLGEFYSIAEDNPLQYLYFEETDFDGFDFTHYRENLRENNWNIHNFSSPEFEDDRSNTTLENTYLKARHGANNFGDNKAASEFFIKEMEFRKKTHLESFRSAEEKIASFKYLANFVANFVIGKISGYGKSQLV